MNMFRLALLASTAALACMNGAFAQDAADETTIRSSEEIVVLGQIYYRNRTDATAPVLEYGLDYFQRFEPLTAGDALKRVPSVAFLSDITESDGVRLRGLDPAYTQILINGELVPGSGSSSGAFGNGADGSFFVDRIPAELIERVEIVRSSSANRSGDAMAGAINIVLRDGYSLDGGYVRAGGLYFENDEKFGETFGGVYGGQIGEGRFLIGANLQDRHNPKDKFSARFDAPGGSLDDTEIQTDVRDGTDYSANAAFEIPVGPGELKLDGFWVQTDRFEDEDSIEYDGGVVDLASLKTVNANDTDIDQTSLSFNGRYKFDWVAGETRVKLGWARFENEEFEFENEATYDDDGLIFPEVDEFERTETFVDLTDEEFKAKLEHTVSFNAANLEFGVHYEKKERDSLISEGDDDVSPPDGTLAPDASGTGLGLPAITVSPVPGGDNTIERTRIDPYVMLSGLANAVAWEVGLRYETTEVEIDDRTVPSSVEDDYANLLPSTSLKWNFSENYRLILSAARTIRNPSFSFLSPALLEAELGDNDFEGNPNLEPETAWGADVGLERRLGKTGVAGINFFYRDVSDVIEVFSTGVVGSEGAPNTIYSARNSGDGEVWGVEFDLSAPLSIVGLDDTGVFLNYSWLDSEIDDEFGSRRFNDQAEYILNVGFIQDIPVWNAAFGVTYRKQGDAESRVVGEEVVTKYGADLEAFIEKSFGERFTLRLTGSNLLDESKDEFFNKFDTTADQISRSFDEYEVESETSGPYFQLIGRLAF